MAIAPTEIQLERASLVPSSTRIGMWHRLKKHRLAQLGFALVVLLLLAAIFAPLLTKFAPDAIVPKGLNFSGEPHPPGDGFVLGADALGRDVWSRVVFGARISLLVGVFAMVTAVIVGTTIGLLSGFFGGWVDAVLMRFTEIIMSLPTILLAIALRVAIPDEIDWKFSFAHIAFEIPMLYKLLLAIGLVTWTGIARAVRGEVLSLKEREFVEAARAVGCSNTRILRTHLLPNVAPTIIVLAALAMAHNILLEAGLSYLGLGVEASIPSWGNMIKEGQAYFISAPWTLLAPGVAIVLTVAAFNFLGQAMQESLDTRKG